MTSPAWSLWPAPAKLNLFLRIVGRRADGYHLLQTCFQLLDWGDTIRLRVRDDGEIIRVDPLAGVDPESDLTVRAARALKRATDCPLGADIAVDKRIPIGGGLGGGSSDAATTLVALNALWGAGLEVEALAELGLALGADVPVFVCGRGGFAEGIGEVLTPVELPERWFVIVDPGVSVPTGPLFQAPELTREAVALTIPGFLSGAAAGNAFEPVVRARFVAVDRAFAWLARHGEPRLSGSGGCVFVDVASAAAGQTIAAEVPAGMRAFVARGMNRSPLVDALARDADAMSSFGGASPSW